MSRPRSVLIHRTGLNRELWWFPYTERGTRLMRALLGYRHSGGVGQVVDVVRRLVKGVRP
jgi:hypothetical protein